MPHCQALSSSGSPACGQVAPAIAWPAQWPPAAASRSAGSCICLCTPSIIIGAKRLAWVLLLTQRSGTDTAGLARVNVCCVSGDSIGDRMGGTLNLALMGDAAASFEGRLLAALLHSSSPVPVQCKCQSLAASKQVAGDSGPALPGWKAREGWTCAFVTVGSPKHPAVDWFSRQCG